MCIWKYLEDRTVICIRSVCVCVILKKYADSSFAVSLPAINQTVSVLLLFELRPASLPHFNLIS
jgi:hypothetical protein